MVRRLFSTISALCLIAFVALCVLWYRTSLTPESVMAGRIRIVSFNGSLIVANVLSISYFAYLWILLGIPGAWLLSHSGKRRVKGICHLCGYDLRASTDRCPECGTPVEQEAREA